MGPKVKKAPKNAFSFFLDDYVENAKEQGRQVSHRIAAEECAPLWKQLPHKEKEKYFHMASTFKEYSKTDKTQKFTTSGISYAQLEKEQEELRLKIEEADTEIKMTISNLDSDLLKTHLFYIIHCNYYCRTFEGTFVPGEIAIVEFSLGDGIRRTYHTLVDPGDLPLGYAFESKQSIEQIHGLPYPPYEEGDSDYCGILNKILDFLEPGKLPDGRYPPIYCHENNSKASENILQSLCDSRNNGQNYFRVYLLQKMFFWLKNKCVECLDEEHVGFPVLSSAESEISKDVFCYTPGISCTFHLNSEEKYYNCSLSVVQRLVYIICDHCCQYIEVELVPGKHCGLKCDTKREETKSRLKKLCHHSGCRPSGTASEVGFDDRSSFADGVSTLECKRERDDTSTFECKRERDDPDTFECKREPSYLHEEIESSYNAFDVSSVSSFSSRNISVANAPSVRGRRRTRGGKAGDAESSRSSKRQPLGRGAGFL